MISDGHFTSKQPKRRRDNIFIASTAKLNFILNKAVIDDAVILQAGDMTHTPRDFPILLNMIKELLRSERVIYYVKGEHDAYNRSRRPALMDVLSEMGSAKLLISEPVEIDDTHIYGASLKEKIPKVEDKKKFNILVCHKDISNRPIYPGHKYTDSRKFLQKNKDFDFILCGHIHQTTFHFIENRFYVNTGPIVRRSIDERKHRPCFFMLRQTEGQQIIEKHPIPYKKTAFSHQVRRAERREKMLKEFSTKAKLRSIEPINIRQVYNEFLQLNQKDLGYKVINILQKATGIKHGSKTIS